MLPLITCMSLQQLSVHTVCVHRLPCAYAHTYCYRTDYQVLSLRLQQCTVALLLHLTHTCSTAFTDAVLITNRLMRSVFEALYHLNQPPLISILVSEGFVLKVADVWDHGAESIEPTGHRQYLESAQIMQILPITVRL
jgi:hypothetical protein